MTGSVDAWGTVQVPAGSFEALRMHVRGEGEFGISVAGETITLRQVIDQYTWIALRVGTVANIQMISVLPVGDTALLETVVSSVMFLQSFFRARGRPSPR